MQELEVMVYLMTGFLESGKTSFLRFTLEQDYFQEDGTTLVILTEEGEEEYDTKKLEEEYDTVFESVGTQEELNPLYLQMMEEKYHPVRVIIEYNGMWRVSDFEGMPLPEGWGITQKLTTVDASTFDVYMANMKPLFVEMVRGADMVLFNRCKDIKPLAGYRRSVKAVSPQAEVIFEGEEGEISNIFADEMPFDIKAPIIKIANEDYGIWHIDVMDHPERYKDRIVEFTGKAMRAKGMPEHFIIPGRMAMTCCADDTTFIGYVCQSDEAKDIKNGQWVTVRAKVDFKKLSIYGGVGPALTAITLEKAEPIKELVYFN